MTIQRDTSNCIKFDGNRSLGVTAQQNILFLQGFVQYLLKSKWPAGSTTD